MQLYRQCKIGCQSHLYIVCNFHQNHARKHKALLQAYSFLSSFKYNRLSQQLLTGRRLLFLQFGLLLARLMGQYCFVGWRLSSVVVCNAAGVRAGRPPGAWTVGAPAAGRVGGRADDTARRDSTALANEFLLWIVRFLVALSHSIGRHFSHAVMQANTLYSYRSFSRLYFIRLLICLMRLGNFILADDFTRLTVTVLVTAVCIRINNFNTLY